MRLLTAFLAAAAFGLAPSAAEVPNETIRSFNEAVSGGDVEAQLEAAMGLASAAMNNPDDPRAAVLAYEAAWRLCQVDACRGAGEPARFAQSLPASDDHPIAVDRTLLVAFVDWTLNPERRTRRALDDALAEVAGTEPSVVTLTAFNNRMVSDMQASAWRQLQTSAGEAARHFEPARDVVGDRWVEASLAEIVAGFNRRPSKQQQIKLSHLRGKLGAMRRPYFDRRDDSPVWLDDAFFRVQAWELAISAYLASSNEREAADSELQDILASYDDPEAEGSSDSLDELPFCEGYLVQSPALTYPQASLRSRVVGAVLVGLRVEEGEVHDVRILASVPVEGFRDEALKTVSQWDWAWAEEQPIEPCSRSHDDMVLPLVWAFR